MWSLCLTNTEFIESVTKNKKHIANVASVVRPSIYQALCVCINCIELVYFLYVIYCSVLLCFVFIAMYCYCVTALK